MRRQVRKTAAARRRASPGSPCEVCRMNRLELETWFFNAQQFSLRRSLPPCGGGTGRGVATDTEFASALSPPLSQRKGLRARPRRAKRERGHTESVSPVYLIGKSSHARPACNRPALHPALPAVLQARNRTESR